MQLAEAARCASCPRRQRRRRLREPAPAWICSAGPSARRPATSRRRSGVEHLLHALAQEIRGPAGGDPLLVRHRAGRVPPAPRRAGPRPRASRRRAGAGDRRRRATARRRTRAISSPTPREGRFDPVIGRDVEVRRLLQILERRFKNHPLLVGEPGVGKTAHRPRARRSHRRAATCPSNLAGAQLLELDTGALVAGAKLRGEIEQRLKQRSSTSSAATPRPETILVVEDLDALFGQGAQGSRRRRAAEAAARARRDPPPRDDDARGRAQDQRPRQRHPPPLHRDHARSARRIEQATEILRGIATNYESAPPRAHRRGRDRRGGHARQALRPGPRAPRHRGRSARRDLRRASASRSTACPPRSTTLIRRVESLKAQIAALADDDDELSVKTRERLEKELAELEPAVAEHAGQARPRARGVVAAVQAHPQGADDAKQRRSRGARKDNDFAKLGELEHVHAPRHQAPPRGGRAGGRASEGVTADVERASTEEDVAHDAQRLDRHPRRQDARGRGREAPQDGGAPRPARRRPGRSGARHRQGGAARSRRASAIPASPSARSSSSGRAASARPSSPRRSPSSSSTTSSR